ncbi:glycosyltransferase family 39 protein [Lysobacter tyrosinilyticus]
MGVEVMATRDDARFVRGAFWALWTAVLLFKLTVAARLPLFVDEAFYWQEGQHLAAAYSDLPGMTAWLARLGVALGGQHVLALRAPFLIVVALVPILMARLTAREFGERSGWEAGCFALLLPLSGTLGLLALPDAMLALATLLCVDAGARLLREVTTASALELALGLSLGALSHYRFVAVIGVGFCALLILAEGRRSLRDPRVWGAIALGALAWLPLLAWNLRNADAGLRFQLVDRHPWSFHLDGLWFVAIQMLLVTPLLFVGLMQAAWSGRRSTRPVSRYFALLGGLVVAGFFLLGFFADSERVSFHWPLPGYLALVPLLPAVLAGWPRALRTLAWMLAGLGLLATLGYYIAVSVPAVRASGATSKGYPANFSGWNELADAVQQERERMPADTRVIADNFKVGAELGFALGDPAIPVLDHPLNHKHGRAPQLHLWSLEQGVVRDWSERPALLVVGISDVPYRGLLQRYHALCEMVGPLPAPRVLNVDHGRRRFALFALDERRTGACTTPAMAWIDSPAGGDRVAREFQVRGWAFKDGVGLASVEVLLDGRVVASGDYGKPYEGLQHSWPGSNDPQHPNVGFSARVQLPETVAGRHWLGLRLHGRDGSSEDWSEQPIEIR